MPVTMIGMKLISGPPVSNPKRPLSQPHWKTAVVAPKVARMLSRKPAVALSGTTTERKTSIRIRTESTMMMPR